jgi:hypothetical protein
VWVRGRGREERVGIFLSVAVAEVAKVVFVDGREERGMLIILLRVRVMVVGRGRVEIVFERRSWRA